MSAEHLEIKPARRSFVGDGGIVYEPGCSWCPSESRTTNFTLHAAADAIEAWLALCPDCTYGKTLNLLGKWVVCEVCLNRNPFVLGSRP